MIAIAIFDYFSLRTDELVRFAFRRVLDNCHLKYNCTSTPTFSSDRFIQIFKLHMSAFFVREI